MLFTYAIVKLSVNPEFPDQSAWFGYSEDTITAKSYKDAAFEVFALEGFARRHNHVALRTTGSWQVWVHTTNKSVERALRFPVIIIPLEEKSSKFVRGLKATGRGFKVAGIKVVTTDLGDIGRGTKKVFMKARGWRVVATK